jgi:hypothetical protein
MKDKVKKLNKWRWILFGSMILIIFIGVFFIWLGWTQKLNSISEELTMIIFAVFLIFPVVLVIALSVLLLNKRKVIPVRFKQVVLFLILISAPMAISFKMDDINNYILKGFWLISFCFTMVLPVVAMIFYMDILDKLIPAFIPVIIAGIIANRLAGQVLAIWLLGAGFGLSFEAFLLIVIKAFSEGRKNRFYLVLLTVFSLVLGVCYILFLVRFTEYYPAKEDKFDTIIIIIFLILSLGLLISMPFSGFTGWTDKQRKIFNRAVLIPMVFVFLIFSMKFLLPSDTYRKLFFKEFTNERVHFDMKDYTLPGDH